MKKLSPKQLLKLKLAKPDIADFILRMQENENEEKISSVMMRKTEEDTDSFRKIKTIVGRDGAGIAEIDLVGYELVVTLDNGVQKTLGNIRGPAGKDGYKPSRDELLELIKPLIPKVSNGVNGKDGVTPTDKQLLSLIKPLIPNPIEGKPGESGKPGKDGSPDTGSQIIDKINKTPKDGPKIKAIHIEDFKVEGKKLFEEQYIHRGGQRLRVRELDGTPNIADVREIRVTNGTITDLGNGVVEVTLSGGAGSTVETPTGAVDGSNKTYTVTSEPKWVVADGVTYFDGAGYTYGALTITLDSQPVSFIRSIY